MEKSTWGRFEEIHYDLRYWGDDPDIEGCLVRAIALLPEKVAAFALERCGFLKKYWISRFTNRLLRRDGISVTCS